MDHRGENPPLLTSLWEYAHASPNEEGDANSEDSIGDHRDDSYGSASSTAGIEEGSGLNSSIPDEQEPLMNDTEFTFINYTPNNFVESSANPADSDVDSMDKLASHNEPENHQAPTLSELLQDNPGHF
ncbi:hypothetical protein N0V85_006204 [Neurospora sp. IMI 360204]|nr:hypothetical protein N0V85_006204 [Neurospora sp. IMI 360204]